MKIKSFLLAGVFIVLSLFFAAPMNAKAANFTIDKYEVNMKVTKDNTYQIKEHIEVNFKSKSHGIYRDIPLVNDVKREDGSSNRIVARVENLDCGDEEYESSKGSLESYCVSRYGRLSDRTKLLDLENAYNFIRPASYSQALNDKK